MSVNLWMNKGGVKLRVGSTATAPAPAPAPTGGAHVFYTATDWAAYATRMPPTPTGPYYATGDVSANSYNAGQQIESWSAAFMANPTASRWVQKTNTGETLNRQLAPGDMEPGTDSTQGNRIALSRFMDAAFLARVYNDSARREAVKQHLLWQATEPTTNFNNPARYPDRYHGGALNPIFVIAAWVHRHVKARDLLGRAAFTASENATFDRWIYGWANWCANFAQRDMWGNKATGRLTRNYSTISGWGAGTTFNAYDGMSNIEAGGSFSYNNRTLACSAAATAAATYLSAHGYTPSSPTQPWGNHTISRLLLEGQLAVEESCRFTMFPQGFFGEFERGDNARHNGVSAQQGWLYACNTVNNLVAIVWYHHLIGDNVPRNYKTSAGLFQSVGTPTLAGHTGGKSVEFAVEANARYVNDAWGRRNRTQPLYASNAIHDVLGDAMAARLWPNNATIQAAYKRSGLGMPGYPSSPLGQGAFDARRSEQHLSLGLIEDAQMPAST